MAFSALVENRVPLPTNPVVHEPQENDVKNAGVQIGEGERLRRNEGPGEFIDRREEKDADHHNEA